MHAFHRSNRSSKYSNSLNEEMGSTSHQIWRTLLDLLSYFELPLAANLSHRPVSSSALPDYGGEPMAIADLREGGKTPRPHIREGGRAPRAHSEEEGRASRAHSGEGFRRHLGSVQCGLGLSRTMAVSGGPRQQTGTPIANKPTPGRRGTGSLQTG